jgi:hypothetical protein
MKITAKLDTDEIKQALANYIMGETGGTVDAASVRLWFEKAYDYEPGSREKFSAEIDVVMDKI